MGDFYWASDTRLVTDSIHTVQNYEMLVGDQTYYVYALPLITGSGIELLSFLKRHHV